MSLMHVSSPHVHKPDSSVEQVMKQVLLATIPGVLVLTWFFGPGTIINIVFGSALALAFEAWALWLRGRTINTAERSQRDRHGNATLYCITPLRTVVANRCRYRCLGSPRQTRIRGLGV